MHPGWPEFHQRLKDRILRDGASALPSALRQYLDRILEETGVPVRYVGFGPGREETVPLAAPTGPPHRAPITPWTG
jgi:adenylosuccinate synthase